MKLKTYSIHPAIAGDLAAVHVLMGHGCAMIRVGDTNSKYFIDTWLNESELRHIVTYAAALHIYLTQKEQYGDAMPCIPERLHYDPEYELALIHLGVESYCVVPTSPPDEIVYVGDIEDIEA